jgi:hypothetical protein
MFYLILGTHHYKYIVDQEWRLDEDAPTVCHQQVWNNVVEVKRPVFEYTAANWIDSDGERKNTIKKKNQICLYMLLCFPVCSLCLCVFHVYFLDEDERKSSCSYSQRVPLSSDYVNEPIKLPPHLTEIVLNQTEVNHISRNIIIYLFTIEKFDLGVFDN